MNQYKISLWGTNDYGFGMASGTLMYSSSNYHKIYNSVSNTNTFTIDSAGSITCAGNIDVNGTIATRSNTISLKSYFQPNPQGNLITIVQ